MMLLGCITIYLIIDTNFSKGLIIGFFASLSYFLGYYSKKKATEDKIYIVNWHNGQTGPDLQLCIVCTFLSRELANKYKAALEDAHRSRLAKLTKDSQKNTFFFKDFNWFITEEPIYYSVPSTYK
jgi:hypothetical protein